MKKESLKKQVEEVVQIALGDLCPGDGNRKVGGFDQKKLEQLAESIKAVGVQQPAVVRKISGKMAGVQIMKDTYEIVAGERRWRASKIAGLETLPCVVRNLDDVTTLKIRTIENLQREDVHPLDEADGYAQLLDRSVYDVEHLAQELGKSISYVYQRLKLIELIPAARKMLVEGKITAGHAILIARLQPDQQKKVMECHFMQNNPTVRDLDHFICEQVMMDLSKTAFKKDDADLVPAAGACADCQKRTGFQAALFADVCKKDYCLDKNCFQKKMDALVACRRAEIATEEHLLVRENYGSEKGVPKEAIEHHLWQECKAKDAGAVRCLVVDGVGRGRLTWGKKSEGYKYQPSPQEKAAAEKKKRELEVKRAARRQVWDKFFEAFTTSALNEIQIPIELLRIIVTRAWEKLWHNSKTTFAKVEGWEKPKKSANDYSNGREAQGQKIIATLDRTGLILFLTKIFLVDALDVQPQYGPQFSDKCLNDAAEILGLDPKAIEAAVRKEEAEKIKTKTKEKTSKHDKRGGAK